MARRDTRNVFDLGRDTSTDTPSSLEGLLPDQRPLPPLAPGPKRPSTDQVQPAKSHPAAPVPVSIDDPKPAAADGQKPAAGEASKPRGSGGPRPRDDSGAGGGITAVPARVPAELYAAAETHVKGTGKPSWGQLVGWTCQDHHDAVLDQVLAQLEPAGGRRRLVGQNRAGTAGVQVTARVDPDELAAIDQLVDEARRQTRGRVNRVPRTAIVIAALTVAINQP